MLLACAGCHRPYEVGDLKTGERVRCPCGHLTPVPAPRVLQLQMAHCGNCGAELESEASTCAHCEARVTQAEEGFGDACPHCFARLLRGARYCHACGRSVEARGMLQALTDARCPRCAQELKGIAGVERPHYQCTVCAGIWLARDDFQAHVDETRARGASPDEQRRVAQAVAMRPARRRGRPSGALARCPVCRNAMRALEFGRYSGVVVDQCTLHGWWFDEGELAALDPFLRGGGLEAAEKRVKARVRSRRMVEAWRRRCDAEKGWRLPRRPGRRGRRRDDPLMDVLLGALASWLHP